MKKATIVTSALPYANGPVHIGHLAGAYLPADIYVRFLKLMGGDVIYICGTDEHGTPITFQAEKKHVSPQVIVDEFFEKIRYSLLSAGIELDYFGRTSHPSHYKVTQEFFTHLLENGFIETHEEEHFFCDATQQFLPDRYIEGECPYCGNPKARGDECSQCGKWLEADKLKNPSSPSCPVDLSKKLTKHWYLSLDKLQPQLEKWIDSKTDWKENVVAFVKGWFKEGLKPRAITRDLSWGVPLPLADPTAQGKVLYVWFDAPVGYLSMTQEWAKTVKQDPELWKKYWLSENSELIHFLGKDNIPFHAIVWPGMLMGQKEKFVLPSYIPANEHLTIEGEKISSSRGNAVWIEEVVNVFGADYLRFYLACIAPENRDADFSWSHFGHTINTDLVNTLGNLYQRLVSFVADRFGGIIPSVTHLQSEDQKILDFTQETLEYVKKLYSQFQVKDVYKALLDLGRMGNAYFQEFEPWKWIKENPEQVGTICNVLARLLEVLYILWIPIIPESAKKLLESLGSPFISNGANLQTYNIVDPQGRKVVKRDPFFKRIEDKILVEQKEILNKRMEKLMNDEKNIGGEKSIISEKPLVTIEDFSKLSIQTAKIKFVENVPKSKKLLRFLLDTAHGERQILSGIAAAYPDPQVLVGKYVAFVANFPPREMMGFESNGMILSAENSNGIIQVVEVSPQVGLGAIIK